MKRIAPFIVLSFSSFVFADVRPAPDEVFSLAVERLADVYAPAKAAEPRTFSATLKVVRAPMREVAGREATLAYQAPDRLRIAAEVDGSQYALGRDGQEVWMHAAGKKWGIVGRPGLQRFATNPASVDHTTLPPFTFPERAKIALLPTLCTFEV
jgi:hypothetical protein